MNYFGNVSSLGCTAEEYFFDVFMNGSLKQRMKKIFLPDSKYGAMRANEEMDRKEGTDFFFKGIRFDFATCYSYSRENYCKDGMVQEFQDKVEGYYSDVYLGIRNRNSDTFADSTFKYPVVVIGGCCNNLYEAKKLIHFMCDHWNEIFEKACILRKKYLKERR